MSANSISQFTPSDIGALGLLGATILLFCATVWYSWATSRMAKLMRLEYQLKITPMPGFNEPNLTLRDGELIVEQTVTNVGVSYFSLEGLNASVWRYDQRNDIRVLRPNAQLPMHFAPGQATKIDLVLDKSSSDNLLGTSFSKSPIHVVGGIVIAQFMGLDQAIHKREMALPQARW